MPYMKMGNGIETTYAYDKQRERLQEMNLSAGGNAVMHNKYQYDAVDNILGITNAISPMGSSSSSHSKSSANSFNPANLGGASRHVYQYDALNRLIHATGKAKNASYDMAMTFGRMSEPLTNVQKVDSSATAKSYNFVYKYDDENHPTAHTQIGHSHYTYDANGNPVTVVNDSTNETREMFWDENNRLMVLSDNGKTSRYTYNAADERIVKSFGDMEGVYVNGAPQGITFHETDNFTLYPASILTVNKNRFTKHYFIGDKRVASSIGTGMFNNVYGVNGSYVTAGQKDYAERMSQIETQKEEYYKELGIAPGVPTMKGAYGDPENTGKGYNLIVDSLGNHDVPEGWIQTPKHNDNPGTAPSVPITWNDPVNVEDPQPGYGFNPSDTSSEEDMFFYHSDHLGSTSYITDAKGNITQYDAYLPYGELLADEHSSSEDMPYKFNGKEMDAETGLYYYGARYMDPVASVWYGVDPMTEKYASASAYTYTKGNPIKFVDTDGNIVVIWYGAKGNEKSFVFTGFHGKKYIKFPNNKFVKDVLTAYVYNAKHGGGKSFIKAVYSKKVIYVDDARVYNGGEDEFGNEGHQITVHWNPRQGLRTTEGGYQSPATRLEHEMDHAFDYASNAHDHNIRNYVSPSSETGSGYDAQYETKEERRVITGSEALTARRNGEAIRKNHHGTTYATLGPTTTKSYNKRKK